MTSTNKRAEQILGKRDVKPNQIIIDYPCELGYHCPVCEYEHIFDGMHFDERLEWSEYNGMIWCSVCDKDYFSFQCLSDVDKQIEIALDTMEDVRGESYREGVGNLCIECGEEVDDDEPITNCHGSCRMEL